MTSLRRRMIEDMQVRNLSRHTQTSYVQQVSLFARHFGKWPELLNGEMGSRLYRTQKQNVSAANVICELNT